jgi:hypothetical protein
MSVFTSPEARAAVVRHPFFLAGLSVVGLLGLTAGALVLFESVRGGSNAGSPTVVVGPAGTSTIGPVSKTASASGVLGTTKRVTTVRTAPGETSPVRGTLPSARDVEIDGRTTDAKWFRIVFPPESELHGWVNADDLEISGNPSALVIATAEPPAIVVLPTEPPAVLTAVAETQIALANSSPTPTPTPDPNSQLPDLVVGTVPVVNGDRLFVTVKNQGKGDAKGDLVVAVFNADASAIVGGATLPNFTLPAGRSIDVGTGFIVSESQTLLLIVDPNGTIEESDNSNNRITVAIAVGDGSGEEDPFATATPTPEAGIPTEAPPDPLVP